MGHWDLHNQLERLKGTGILPFLKDKESYHLYSVPMWTKIPQDRTTFSSFEGEDPTRRGRQECEGEVGKFPEGRVLERNFVEMKVVSLSDPVITVQSKRSKRN